MHQLDDAILAAHLEKVLVQLETAVVGFVLFPPKKELLGCPDAAVLQPLGVVTGKDELNRAEEPSIELGLLVREILADAVTNSDAAVLEFHYTNRDAVDV